jgi:NAD(P)-dependent dehydrogenase (short-subunit alcohol dehydrogenase family)
MTALPGTAWITGASSGIGRELALQLARRGTKVAASARNREALDALAAQAPPGAIRPVPLDVADRAAVAPALAAVTAALGGLPDLAVLNAGTYIPLSAGDFDAAKYRAQIEINLMGTVHCLEALMPPLMAAGRGHIAVVASVAGYRGLPTGAAYGATKAALINLCESLKFDLDRAGVKLQLVNPGFVKTPLTDKNQFRMPYLMPVDKAAARMIEGFASSRFEIAFPRRFALQLKFMRILPYRPYFWLAKKATGA